MIQVFMVVNAVLVMCGLIIVLCIILEVPNWINIELSDKKRIFVSIIDDHKRIDVVFLVRPKCSSR
mgnify:CR=1 FL=1